MRKSDSIKRKHDSIERKADSIKRKHDSIERKPESPTSELRCMSYSRRGIRASVN